MFVEQNLFEQIVFVVVQIKGNPDAAVPFFEKLFILRRSQKCEALDLRWVIGCANCERDDQVVSGFGVYEGHGLHSHRQ